ncbi:hypothetical protein D1007_29461 [Hordeum vulgare]|nr:hypothetical protein D1007_29461 [Hordeum vulgare]
MDVGGGGLSGVLRHVASVRMVDKFRDGVRVTSGLVRKSERRLPRLVSWSVGSSHVGGRVFGSDGAWPQGRWNSLSKIPNPEKKLFRMPSADAEIAALHKEWDDARCPICMDHPHNAVLLLCSSQDKGCRSYMCDTSYGHSECLYGFRKMKANRMDSSSQPSSSLPGDTSNQGVSQRSRLSHSTGSPRLLVDVPEFRENLSHEHVIRSSAAVSGQQGTNYNQGPVTLEAHMGQVSGQVESAEVSNSNQLMCPLCRGDVKGWEIIKDARRYLDEKQEAARGKHAHFLVPMVRSVNMSGGRTPQQGLTCE